MRRWLGLICLVIIFLQGVPLKGMCKLLSKQHTTVVTDIAADDSNDSDDEDDTALQTAIFDVDIIIPDHSFHIPAIRPYFRYKQPGMISGADALPSLYTTEVTVPPPDRA